MDKLKIGQIIKGPQKRDSVHMAIAPVVAATQLEPGEHIGLLPDGTAGNIPESIGIVDPFLKSPGVRKGQTFWIFLYPGSITSLRHDWSHPAFPEQDKTTPANKELSERWLRDFIEHSDCPSYETVIETCLGNMQDEGCYLNGEYLHFNDYDVHGDIPPEFWDHVEVVTGLKMTHRPSYFSCSC